MELKSIVAKSHQGPFLQVNEDAYDFDLEHKLYMLFDGFGGGATSVTVRADRAIARRGRECAGSRGCECRRP